jgi:hypothetical protein
MLEAWLVSLVSRMPSLPMKYLVFPLGASFKAKSI